MWAESKRASEVGALVAVAAEASAASLEAFVEEAIQPGSLVHTDGWEG